MTHNEILNFVYIRFLRPGFRFRNDGKQERVKKEELAKTIKKYKKEGKFSL